VTLQNILEDTVLSSGSGSRRPKNIWIRGIRTLPSSIQLSKIKKTAWQDNAIKSLFIHFFLIKAAMPILLLSYHLTFYGFHNTPTKAPSTGTYLQSHTVTLEKGKKEQGTGTGWRASMSLLHQTPDDVTSLLHLRVWRLLVR
jgi:hypothetical protein